MKFDFTKPAPQFSSLKEANATIKKLWPICAKVNDLEDIVENQKEKLSTNSKNSSLPPSKDKPSSKKNKKKKSPTRKQGAQPGHKANKRELLPSTEVDHIETIYPEKKCSCGGAVHLTDQIRRHQTHDLPVVTPIVTEYQMKSGECCLCEKIHWASLPKGVPSGMLSPRSIAVVSSLTGSYRMSKRNVVGLLEDLYSFKIAVGSVVNAEKIASQALKNPVEEAKTFVKEADDAEVHADETGHKEKGKKMWAWVAVTMLVCVFIIRASRGADVAKELLGAKFKGILNSDRWSAYSWVATIRRQLCWAHLKRDFKKIAERSGVSKIIGERLLFYERNMFIYWRKVKCGEKTKEEFQNYMKRIRREVEKLLKRGERCRNKKTAGTCKHILKLKDALWTFVDCDGVDPTNNTAEQVIRTHVIWRKVSFGTQSASGTLYMERVLTAVGSCKLQGKNVLDFMTHAIKSHFDGSKAPSLIPENYRKHTGQLKKSA